MNTYWMETEVSSLSGKTVVMTGATGGLGQAMCRQFLGFGSDLIMVARNEKKAVRLQALLQKDFPDAKISFLLCDLSVPSQVKELSAQLQQLPVDILMLNAGTYAIPRALSSHGLDTVFETNFLSHYYLVKKLLPLLKERKGKVVATGSIAHQFNSLDPRDPDFARHEGANNIYGNSKRFLMFATMELLRNTDVSFAIGHPGISYTGITANYPPEILKIVKPSMLLLFQHPEQACLSMVRAVFADVPFRHWIGPGYFDVWGDPVISPLHSCSRQEQRELYQISEKMVSEY